MATIPDTLNLALRHHQAGRLPEAEALYRQILQAHPNHPDTLHLLGVIAHQVGKHDAAIEYISRAIAARPEVGEFHNNLGEAHRALGRLDDAVASYRRALKAKPAYPEAHNNLGIALQAQGKMDEAAAAYKEALALNPGFAEAHANWGATLQEQGKPDEAVVHYRQAISIKPAYAEAYYNLGKALQEQGKPDEAVAHYRQALALKPAYVKACNNLGTALHELGNLDEAVAVYRQALQYDPSFAAAYANLGAALQEQGKLQEAVEAYRHALARRPDHPEGYTNLAHALVQMGNLEEAAVCYRRALGLNPDLVTAKDGLIGLLPQIAEWEGLKNLLSEWRNGSLLSDVAGSKHPLLTLAYAGPFVGLAKNIQRTVLASCSRCYVDRAKSLCHEGFRYSPKGDKLRIGYVSPNFGDHPVAHVVKPIFEFHDRQQFEIFCYSLKDRSFEQAPYLRDIKSRVEHFHDLATLSHVEAARLINRHGVQVLVDLTGYMTQARPEIFALRPAPVQVYWIGHGGGLQAPFIDYVIGDPIVTPKGCETEYVERLVRLPDVFCPADCPEISPAPQRRAEYGLPEEGFVFCGFNALKKIDPTVFAAWMQILKAVPKSVLWLSEAQNLPAQQNLRAAAKSAGVDPQRLVFATRVADKSVHLARHQLAGLFLDTFRVNAATTALDALWAGLPLLTVPGDDYFSRVAASLLTAIGLEEMICASVEDYVEQAISLAQHPKELRAICGQLRRNRTSTALFDRTRFVKNLERAYAKMWQMHEAGKGLKGFDVPVQKHL